MGIKEVANANVMMTMDNQERVVYRMSRWMKGVVVLWAAKFGVKRGVLNCTSRESKNWGSSTHFIPTEIHPSVVYSKKKTIPNI